LNRRSPEGFAVGAGTDNITIFGAELVEGVIISGKRDGTNDGFTDGRQRTVLRIDSQGMDQNLKSIMRHIREYVEERLTITTEVREEDI